MAGPRGPPARLFVDSGHSFTHIVPYIDGQLYKEVGTKEYGKTYIHTPQGLTRIDVGGKALTNYLKDVLSYRQLDLSEETYVLNAIKVCCCCCCCFVVGFL